MSAMTSRITGVTIAYSIVCSGADRRKHQSSASLALVRGIHQWPANSPYKGLVKRKMFQFDDVIMLVTYRRAEWAIFLWIFHLGVYWPKTIVSVPPIMSPGINRRRQTYTLLVQCPFHQRQNAQKNKPISQCHGQAMWWLTFASLKMDQVLQHPLQWRHNGRDGVSIHQPHDCLLNRLFRRRSKKTAKLCVTGLCTGNSPVTDEFPHKWPVTRKCFHLMTP